MDWKMIGHQWAVDLLASHLQQNSLRHAYLITGPSGVGRRTLGVRLAQALACLQPPEPGQPCLACSACLRLEKMQHPDLIVVQAENVGGTLKVEQIREAQHTLALAPYEAKYRTALFLRFEEAHPSAQNALLKTLEEPPSQVIMILTAESAESVLPTILSRCEVLRLRPDSIEHLRQELEDTRQLTSEKAEEIAHLAGGRPGFAIRLSEGSELLDQHNDWVKDIWTLCGANRVERFAYAQKAVSGGEKDSQLELLTAWTSFWHDILITCTGSSAPLTNLKWNVEIELLARQVTPSGALRMLQAIDLSAQRLRKNINARLTFEVLLLDLPRLRLQ